MPSVALLQGVEPVRAGRLGPRLHVGLVDLDDVDAGREQVQDLRPDGLRVRHAERRRVAVVVVLGLLGHRERPRHRHLRRAARVRLEELCVADLHRMAPGDRADDARDRVRVPAAVERGPRVVDVDAVERGREAVRVALAAHLAVGDDVQARALLVEDRQPRRVVLGLLDPRRVDTPQLARPHARREAGTELVAVEQPRGLGVGAHEARRDLGAGGGRGHSADPCRRSGRGRAHPRAPLLLDVREAPDREREGPGQDEQRRRSRSRRG